MPSMLIDQTAHRDANNCNGKAILLKIIAGIGIARTKSANGTHTSRKKRRPQK